MLTCITWAFTCLVAWCLAIPQKQTKLESTFSASISYRRVILRTQGCVSVLTKSIMKIPKQFILLILCIAMGIGLSSCGGARTSLVVPTAVSTVESIPFGSLNLDRKKYEVLNTIEESATVIVEYSRTKVVIKDYNGQFRYVFQTMKDGSWYLDKFSGVATLGYFETEFKADSRGVPDGAEFARRVAISRIIAAASDYNADGVVEPLTVTSTDGTGSTITYTSTVKAKLIKIKTDL